MKGHDELPAVTVILPIRNEALHVVNVLQAILEQEYGGEIEVLIADGMSTDGTRGIVARMAAEHPELSIQVLNNPSQIVPMGVNVAMACSRGEIIVRVDGHTVIESDYIGLCVEELEASGADNVGGRMKPIGQNAFGRAVAVATSSPFGIGGGRFHYSNEEEWVDTVYMGAWPRRVFAKIGLFDEELVRDQDDEFNYRLREGGGKILLSPKIKSEYTVRGSPSALWRQYFEYGYWKIRVLQKHPLQMQVRQFVPPLFVGALVGSSLLSPFLQPARYALAVVAGSYLVANLAASVITAAKKGWTHLPLLPVTFAILHLSYGVGFLAGLVKFWNRWGDRRGKVPDWKPG